MSPFTRSLIRALLHDRIELLEATENRIYGFDTELSREREERDRLKSEIADLTLDLGDVVPEPEDGA